MATTKRPETAPPRNAIVNALLRLVRAALATRTFALTEMYMPTNPAMPEHSAPTMNAKAVFRA